MKWQLSTTRECNTHLYAVAVDVSLVSGVVTAVVATMSIATESIYRLHSLSSTFVISQCTTLVTLTFLISQCTLINLAMALGQPPGYPLNYNTIFSFTDI